jgi:Zn-dependent peptidase ImmA (M78 family)/RNA polymerase subunit RPABC4/transcription elongation factor Spt4
MIYSKLVPDYADAQAKAYETVQNSRQKKLPLSIKKIIRSFPDLHLQKYSSFAKRRGLTIDEVYELLDSKEGCLWKKQNGHYIILYNDTIENTGRIRFTLAHELGHYIMKHNEKSEKTRLSRYSLSEEEYDVFEKEANYFAKRLLAPIPLVDLYVANWKKIMASSIEFAFDTSYTVANYIISDLIKRNQNSMIRREGHPMVDSFADFIHIDTNSKICKNCSASQNSEHEYCAFCGNISFIQSSPENYAKFNLERKKSMFYSKIQTNEKGLPLKCPNCKAENLHDEFTFCPYCSVLLRNYCLGPHENRFIELDNFGSHEERTLL